MSVKVQWSGLTEFLQVMGSLPRELTAEGMAIVQSETEAAAQDIRRAYQTQTRNPTGEMLRRVRTVYPSSTVLVGMVRSEAPHSHLFEEGTKKRKTARGNNRGTMPAANPPITAVIAPRHRARMRYRLVQLLRRNGFQILNEHA